jgi:glycopeptide antibiotics resistance protein
MVSGADALGHGQMLSAEHRLTQQPILRGDTKTLVGALLLAVAFSVNMQITERIDQIWTGGLGVPLGHTFAQLWWPTAAIFFGLTGALVVANFNPLIAVMSATHPLAWSFFFLNSAETVPLAFMFRAHFKRHSDISLGRFMLYIAIGDGLANLVQAVGLYQVVLKLEFSQIVTLFFWQWGLASTVGGLMGYSFYSAVRRSGVFE